MPGYLVADVPINVQRLRFADSLAVSEGFLTISLGDGVENRFHLKRGQVGIRLFDQRDDPNNVRTGKTVPGQLTITASRPGRLDFNTRRDHLDYLSVAIGKVKGIFAGSFNHRNHGRGKNRRIARIRKIVGGSYDDAAGLVGPIQKIMDGRKVLALGCSQREIDHMELLLDRIVEPDEKHLSRTRALGTRNFHAVELNIRCDAGNDAGASRSVAGLVSRA